MPQSDFSVFQNPIDQLYAQYSGMFVADGQALLLGLVGLTLAIYVWKHGLTGGIWAFIAHYWLMVLIAENLLAYYATPCPVLGNVSVSGFFPVVAEYYAEIIGMKQIDILAKYVVDVLYHLEPVTYGNLSMFFVSCVVQLCCWLVQAIAFGAVAVSFIMIGILRLIGPLFIPWIIVPRLSWLFWNWLQSMMQYAFFRVMSAALVFVVSTAFVSYINTVVHGDFTLSGFATTIPGLLVVTFVSAWCAFRLSSITGDLFKGTSTAGSDLWMTMLAFGKR